jgi:hypothetical protein
LLPAIYGRIFEEKGEFQNTFRGEFCISLTPDDLNPIQQFLFIGSHDGMITVVSKEDHDATLENEEHKMVVLARVEEASIRLIDRELYSSTFVFSLCKHLHVYGV